MILNTVNKMGPALQRGGTTIIKRHFFKALSQERLDEMSRSGKFVEAYHGTTEKSADKIMGKVGHGDVIDIEDADRNFKQGKTLQAGEKPGGSRKFQKLYVTTNSGAALNFVPMHKSPALLKVLIPKDKIQDASHIAPYNGMKQHGEQLVEQGVGAIQLGHTKGIHDHVEAETLAITTNVDTDKVDVYIARIIGLPVRDPSLAKKELLDLVDQNNRIKD